MIILPPGTRAAIFVRISSEGQVKDESPAVHLARSHEYCELHGWPVVAVYQLDAVSGDERFMEHAETKRMWRAVEANQFDVLVFYSLARIGRDLLSLLKIEKHLRDHGKYMASTRRGVVDTSTPEGREAFVNEGSRAQSEREELSLRVRAGLKTRAKLGQIVAATPPYGYRKIPVPGSTKSKTLAIDPIEGPIRALMYELYLKHRRLSRVAAELNARSYRNRAGAPFGPVHVKKLLLESSAMGVYHSNRMGAGAVLKPEEEWIPIACPALVSVEDWERCRALLTSKVRPARKTIWAYSGLLLCGCGEKMYVRSNFNQNSKEERFPPRYECRGCKNKIAVTDLDVAIGKMFKGFLLDGLPDGARTEISQAERQLQGLKAEAKKVKQGLVRWAEAYEAGALDLEAFKSYRLPLLDRQKEITAEVSRLESERRSNKEQLEAQARASEILQAAAWADLYPDEKQELLKEFVQSIVLRQDDIQSQLLYAPPMLQFAEPSFAQLHSITIPRPDRAEVPTDGRVWGACLRRARKERGESAEKVARQLGCTTPLLYHWEQLAYPPGPQYIPKIIKYIGFVPWGRTPYAQATLGGAVRAARELRGLNQRGLSELMQTSQPLISSLEIGRCGLSDKTFAKLEKALKIEVRRLFEAYSNIDGK